MRHIILAIAAIAVVQIAFQLYMADDPQSEYAEGVASASWPTETILTVRGGLPAAALRDDRPMATRVRARKPAERRIAPVRPIASRPALALTATSPGKPAKRIPRPDGPERDDADGKPWIAKALPIVKKPYDWLKALGSKLK